MPGLLSADGLAAPAFGEFPLRFRRRARGRLTLTLDGREVWRRSGLFLPERRLVAPIPAAALSGANVRFRFDEDG